MRSARSAMSFSSCSVSAVRFRIYSLLMLRRRMSATYSAWTLSSWKPSIRLGTTMASFSVPRMMVMALSMSRRMAPRPRRRWSFSSFCLRVNWADRRTQSDRQAVHRSRISPTPMTLGMPSTKMLKLQAKESCSGVMRKSFCMSLSGSVPRFRSMASFRPDRSVSSRMSATSRTLPSLMSSATLSRMASAVVV